MPAFTSQTEMAREGISHLGYPAYFGVMLMVWKVLGSLVLIVPMVPSRIKEWAYGCFAVELICACVSHAVVDGLGGESFFPIIVLSILVLSYISYHKLSSSK